MTVGTTYSSLIKRKKTITKLVWEVWSNRHHLEEFLGLIDQMNITVLLSFQTNIPIYTLFNSLTFTNKQHQQY